MYLQSKNYLCSPYISSLYELLLTLCRLYRNCAAQVNPKLDLNCLHCSAHHDLQLQFINTHTISTSPHSPASGESSSGKSSQSVGRKIHHECVTTFSTPLKLRTSTAVLLPREYFEGTLAQDPCRNRSHCSTLSCKLCFGQEP